MQTKVIRQEKSETEALLEFEVIGENHTWLNMLRETLKDQDGVLFAAYRIPHPILENPIFYLRTEAGIDPLDALKEAADSIIKKCDDLASIVEVKFSD